MSDPDPQKQKNTFNDFLDMLGVTSVDTLPISDRLLVLAEFQKSQAPLLRPPTPYHPNATEKQTEVLEVDEGEEVESDEEDDDDGDDEVTPSSSSSLTSKSALRQNDGEDEETTLQFPSTPQSDIHISDEKAYTMLTQSENFMNLNLKGHKFERKRATFETFSIIHSPRY